MAMYLPLILPLILFITSKAQSLTVEVAEGIDIKLEKRFIQSFQTVLSGYRILSIAEATLYKDQIVSQLGQWEIIKLAGGRIFGPGNNGNINYGTFDQGIGWVLQIPLPSLNGPCVNYPAFESTSNDSVLSIAIDGDFNMQLEQVFIDSFQSIPSNYRQLSVQETMMYQDQILSQLGPYDNITVNGGRIYGSGNNATIEYGLFDEGLGQTFITPLLEYVACPTSDPTTDPTVEPTMATDDPSNDPTADPTSDPTSNPIPAPQTLVIEVVDGINITLLAQFVEQFEDIPSGYRILSMEEAVSYQDQIVRQMEPWDIYKLAGGRIMGSGYNVSIEYGVFDEGIGLVLLIPLSPSVLICRDYVFESIASDQTLTIEDEDGYDIELEKLFITSFQNIPSNYRILSIQEAVLYQNQITSQMGRWEYVKLNGGRIFGPGNSGRIEYGVFDGGVGWIYIIRLSQYGECPTADPTVERSPSPTTEPTTANPTDNPPNVTLSTTSTAETLIIEVEGVDITLILKFITQFQDISSNYRILSIQEAVAYQDQIVPQMGQWHIYKLAGGRIIGPGQNGRIEYGIFDEGVGWVLLISLSAYDDICQASTPGSTPYDKGLTIQDADGYDVELKRVFIDAYQNISSNYRILSVQEAVMYQDQIVPQLEQYDIYKVNGGRITGSGYNGVVEYGIFDEGVGWVLIIPRRCTVSDTTPSPVDPSTDDAYYLSSNFMMNTIVCFVFGLLCL